MKFVYFLTVLGYFVCTKALDCGISNLNKDEIRQSLSMCIKNNETLEKLMAMSEGSSSESDSRSMSTESTEDSLRTTITNSSNSSKSGRIKRAGSTATPKDAPTQGPTRAGTTTDVASTDDDDMPEKCVVHCVLERLEMTDANGLPDHSKFVEGLLKTATGRELRDFLQNTADECFQQMGQDSNLDSCSLSTKLVTCLAEKGRTNCSDWSAGALPF